MVVLVLRLPQVLMLLLMMMMLLLLVLLQHLVLSAHAPAGHKAGVLHRFYDRIMSWQGRCMQRAGERTNQPRRSSCRARMATGCPAGACSFWHEPTGGRASAAAAHLGHKVMLLHTPECWVHAALLQRLLQVPHCHKESV